MADDKRARGSRECGTSKPFVQMHVLDSGARMHSESTRQIHAEDKGKSTALEKGEPLRHDRSIRQNVLSALLANGLVLPAPRRELTSGGCETLCKHKEWVFGYVPGRAQSCNA